MDSAVGEFRVASVTSRAIDGGLQLKFSGRMDANCIAEAWRDAEHAVKKHSPGRLVLDLSEVDYCDTTGVGLLIDLRRKQQEAGGEKYEVRGASEEVHRLLAMFKGEMPGEQHRINPKPITPLEEAIRMGRKNFRDIAGAIAFIGEVSVVLASSLVRPRRVRWRDLFLAAEPAGADALPIVALIGFIMGLVMAFQATIPMKEFGMEIYIADMVAMAMFREMGALTTAVLLAGRAGSAFAAELGTMKINEEVDALRTMGLDPARFLLVPRVLAATVMTPILAVYTTLSGLIGGAVVMMSLDFPAVTYWNRVRGAVELDQVFGGLFKALVFGLIVSAVGCRRGLQTKTGPSAVGVSMTSAVVTSIILVIIADGIFAVIFYYLDI